MIDKEKSEKRTCPHCLQGYFSYSYEPGKWVCNFCGTYWVTHEYIATQKEKDAKDP